MTLLQLVRWSVGAYALAHLVLSVLVIGGAALLWREVWRVLPWVR